MCECGAIRADENLEVFDVDGTAFVPLELDGPVVTFMVRKMNVIALSQHAGLPCSSTSSKAVIIASSIRYHLSNIRAPENPTTLWMSDD
jgi:hypothetical protein